MKRILFTACFITLFFLSGGLFSHSFAHQRVETLSIEGDQISKHGYAKRPDPILCAYVKEGFDTVDTRIVISNRGGILAEGGFTEVCVSDKENSLLQVVFHVGEHRRASASVVLVGAGMDVFISQSDGDFLRISFVPRTSP
ncbi:hypothetical protein HYT45_04605 [Candidatus Uhrbacteria bacterium]|nr:hypothetical protein [Candidatus Uhrbacteria bacterium]